MDKFLLQSARDGVAKFITLLINRVNVCGKYMRNTRHSALCHFTYYTIK
jgi:hypothetical protein